MKNTKGFTLVELLATLTILSIIMLVAVPNTLSVLDKNKKETYISDAKRFVALAESEIRNNDKIDTEYGGFIVFRLDDLNDGTFDKDADNKSYNQTNSYVAVYKKGTAADYQFIYYVQLLGEKRGIPLTEVKSINRTSVASVRSDTNILSTITSVVGVAATEANVKYYSSM